MVDQQSPSQRKFVVRRVGGPQSRAPGDSGKRRVLNTGSGAVSSQRLHAAFTRDWTEVRLDIDASLKPDIVGTISDMKGIVEDASFDAIWASHNIEHLHTHEVGPALGEFRRVLREDGFAFITCPDLEAVADFIATHGATKTAYVSPAGPITGLDMIYGHGASIAKGNHFMCHNTAFTVETLGQAALDAGFPQAHVAQGKGFDLWALFLMPKTDLKTVSALLRSTSEHFLVEDDL